MTTQEHIPASEFNLEFEVEKEVVKPDLYLVPKLQLGRAATVIDAKTLDWRSRTACFGSEPEIFFPDEDEPEQVSAAKAICDICEVETACLEDALNTYKQEGFRGGETETRRRTLRRNLTKARNAAAKAALAETQSA